MESVKDFQFLIMITKKCHWCNESAMMSVMLKVVCETLAKVTG